MNRIFKLITGIAILALTGPALGAGPGKAAISSAHELATAAGFEILEAGGNAFDAAVAVSAALAVVEPSSSGIGGGGFWLLRHSATGHATMVDGRETAPAAAHADMYLDDNGEVDRDLAINGPLSAGIPGSAAAWVHISQTYGRLPLKQVLQPAIRLAREGFPVDLKYQQLLNFRAHIMLRWPETAAIFMPGGDLPEPGRIIVQQDLARTLERLAAHGIDGFYRGETARLLVEGNRAAGGIWTLEDLAGYRAVERRPIVLEHDGYTLITAAPPSSGGIAIAQVLNLIEPFDWRTMARVDRVHLLAEAMRRAYRDRALYLGDPDFVDIPIGLLTDKNYAAGLRTTLRMDRALPSSHLAADPARLHESDNTTHFSLIDADGNMVSATLTVNLPYGSAFAAPGTGVLLNNEMDDFSAKEGEPNAFGLVGFKANAIEPGKRMLSSMSPTIVLGEQRVAILGTPGGSRIISMVILGILDFLEGNGPDSWVALPRFHHQYLPDEISAESGALSDAEIAALEVRGHAITVRERPWGNMHGVLWDRRSNELSAAHDPRWESGGAEVR
ncbi:MAG: gamma-glutamyltransferase [Gammaproteobacteria bacterium HGW-Gammaproteobacteria-8]|nr:MAG: gamma-glutamyltransferase [Gammaproteobacteria bacterium HGW-Gammaproteobacteria-8]